MVETMTKTETKTQDFFSTSPTLFIATAINDHAETVSTQVYLSMGAAESYICEQICEHYEPDTEDEADDNAWHNADTDDLAEVLERDSELDNHFAMSCVKEIDLFQHLPQMAPSANLVLPDARHMP